MKFLRYTLFIITILLAIVLAGSVYLLEYSLGCDGASWDEERAWQRLYDNYPWAVDWLDSVRTEGVLQDTFIVSEDGRRLHAYYLARHPKHDSLQFSQFTKNDSLNVCHNAGTALLLHGYRNCAIDMMYLGYMYHHCLGYNIMLPDLHAHGQSDGEHIRMGWLDRLDAIRWGGVADSLFRAPIVIHGISMGAATVMMLSGEDGLPSCVTHLIEDCGYTSVWDEFKSELQVRFSLPAFPLLYVSSALCDMFYDWDFFEADALSQVKRCQRPMLFIHGDSDKFVPTQMVHPLYEAHPGPKEIWLPEGVAHALSYRTYPEEYTQRVSDFLSADR